jgi:2',3'-cyclic-nucleotide 2'-phosphodiesterase (5'-nucleotidase family)
VIVDPIEAAHKIVRQLKAEGVEMIIAVTHMGSEAYC